MRIDDSSKQLIPQLWYIFEREGELLEGNAAFVDMFNPYMIASQIHGTTDFFWLNFITDILGDPIKYVILDFFMCG